MSDYNEHLISMAGGDGDVVDKIQARADKATAGPWFREYSDVVTARPDPRDVEEGYEDARNSRVVRGAPHLPKKDRQGIADAEFIAHARTDIPALLAMVREQRAAIERVRELSDNAPRMQGMGGWSPGIVLASDLQAALTAPEAS